MIKTLHLFRPLNQKLINLLNDLDSSGWKRKTVAGTWTVKDIASHLLDGNIRTISMYRDEHEVIPNQKISNYSELVGYLNKINADWVKATQRMSPALLVEFLSLTHEAFITALENLDPFSPAKFSVAWAGEEVSTNAFHIAREFTEKWHHQQQIRHAVNQAGILTKEFYFPVLDTFMQALPHHYRNILAPVGTLIEVNIEGDAGGGWCIERQATQWLLCQQPPGKIDTRISIPVEESWKLFTKAVSYSEIKNSVSIIGDVRLAMPTLEMLPIMAER